MTSELQKLALAFRGLSDEEEDEDVNLDGDEGLAEEELDGDEEEFVE